ncbi:MAG: VWA domain-containing protein [Sandaracinaceae bacterium]|nr:VWA domain-containing protein [Sandaracinaceae bacterium]
MRALCPLLVAPLAGLLALGCGSKTGLLIPDSSVEPDAGMDGAVCMPGELVLTRRGAQVIFTIDRSNSMADRLEGGDPMPGEPTRWEILQDALGATLPISDPLLEVGAKFFPGVIPEDVMSPAEACLVDSGIDLEPRRGNAPQLLRFFETTEPRGGTPTAVGLGEISTWIGMNPAPGIPRFVVLATDGGPNCNPDVGIPTDVCLCTGTREDCLSPIVSPYNCIDEQRTQDAIARLFAGQGVPVYVIGIDNPARPDLMEVLDRMAIAGGRPRPDDGGSRFYSVRRTEDLRGALTTITESIARCVFTVLPAPPASGAIELSIEGTLIPRDPTRTEGWDFTTPDRREVSLFGGACERAVAADGVVDAIVPCPPR